MTDATTLEQDGGGLIAAGALLERVATGATWSEGPVWMPEERAVRWSDIPGNRILQYDPATGRMTEHRTGVEFTNGRTVDLDGSVIQCSHGRRAVEHEVDGDVEVLVESWQGRRFNSPNDVVVKSDSTIWFTDPTYGITQPREGYPGEEEYGGRYVFRFDRITGDLDAVITELEQPNGLAFSPDESMLYVSDTSAAPAFDGTGSRNVRVYDIVGGRECVDGRFFAVAEAGVIDGFRIDENGCLWASSADAVEVFDPDGRVVGRIPVPETVANLCFGGDDGRDLYVAASTSLYRIRTTVRAAPRPGTAR